jgi:type II secretory pathway pseudopilin PulG
MKINFQKKYTQKGFTLLFAMLVATMVVAIGASIISIAMRQTILSGTSRESQYAYYAASTALNCAYYWDREPKMPTGLTDKMVFPDYYYTGGTLVDTDDPDGDINCAGFAFIASSTSGYAVDNVDTDNIITTFDLRIKDKMSSPQRPTDLCAQVQVTKQFDDPTIITTIEAKGYNTCDTNNPRRVERGLIQQYKS